MTKNESKIKQREYLSSIIQKIKNENNYDYNINNNRLNLKLELKFILFKLYKLIKMSYVTFN